MNYEYRIKRIRNIIKRCENGSGTVGELVEAFDKIKRQIE